MTKRMMTLLLCLSLFLLCNVATAQSSQGVAYGVYALEGEHPDCLIRVTLTVEDGRITSAKIDDKLIPVAIGGAAGWAELDEDTAAKLGDAVVNANDKTYPERISLGDVIWTATEDPNSGITYQGEIDGAPVELIEYICTDEGGAWYYEQQSASFLNKNDESVAQVQIETKESIGHGVDFWPSELTFPGNIAKIETFLTENGFDWDPNTLTKGEDGVWTCADVVTGATLAGTPNYLRVAKAAYENAIQ